ncbi:Type IV conjugative transfer system protein TraL (plasmid) [Candidatus Protochlamydia naegleriophila]|uniref:Type IV conjugative transfer system protein TraL n=1 Tax=Candidatus Protochlamydia naegleriophila TaxID=389348 RepID=A0A0U5EVB3_9BACT|nr:type IV conjugative transfer system protein TraL [Candidatus Protochlamydia naegleriophila]CUI18211.1 Type IV conjugative transfer system protein TraL [Candidatus Protochlamydia naegleriophila]
MEKKHQLYKTLDNPLRVIFWSIDEFVLMVIPLMIGFMMASPFILLSGIFLKIVCSKFKKKFPVLKHMIYWYLPTRRLRKQKIIKNLPSSHIREFML